MNIIQKAFSSSLVIKNHKKKNNQKEKISKMGRNLS